MERPAEKPAFEPIPVVVMRFWLKYPSVEKARVMEKVLVKDDPSREKRCRDYFKDGQYRNWIATHFCSWIPVGYSDAMVADLVGVHKAQIYRARKYGIITLPTLVQFMRVFNIQSRHLSAFPPHMISTLAGLALTVPLVASFLHGRKNMSDQASQHVTHDPLSLSDCALLFSLTHSRVSFKQWLQTCVRYKADLALALSDSAFQEFLSAHLDGAISLVAADPHALQELSRYKTCECACDCFCRRIAKLWNTYQLAWLFTLEAVNDLTRCKG